MGTREAALAGAWYPGTEAGCRRKIESMLGPEPEHTGRAGIVPHAGWDYSGALALEVYKALAVSRPAPELLLLFGTHMAPSSAPHISTASAFETPLGPLLSDTDLSATLAKELDLQPDPADARRGSSDNTVEVQLPLIKFLMPDVRVVVVSPPASTEAIEIGRHATRRARETSANLAIVGSTDLTHYGPRFGFAPAGEGEEAVRWVENENDAKVIERILEMDAEGVLDEALKNRNACVPGAVAAALSGAMELGLDRAELLRYATSWDVHPGGDTFVGYAALLFS